MPPPHNVISAPIRSGLDRAWDELLPKLIIRFKNPEVFREAYQRLDWTFQAISKAIPKVDDQGQSYRESRERKRRCRPNTVFKRLS